MSEKFGEGDGENDLDVPPVVVSAEPSDQATPEEPTDTASIAPGADIQTTNRPPSSEDLSAIAEYMILVRKGIF
jgi:hypothetical protein